jgi:nucleoside-diphosphate kinase
MEKSLVLIKPDAMQRNLAGKIISRLEEAGLKLNALKMLHMDQELAQRHYAIHQDKPFFANLVSYITSAPIVALVLSGENAVTLIRETMGPTDPAKAPPGTIRGDFGLDIERNSVHGSDSPQNAAVEINIFFGKDEIFA